MSTKNELREKLCRIREAASEKPDTDLGVLAIALELTLRLLDRNNEIDEPAVWSPAELNRLIDEIARAIESGYDQDGHCLFDEQKVAVCLETAYRIAL